MSDLTKIVVAPSDSANEPNAASVSQENYNNNAADFAATSDSIDTDITYAVVRDIVNDVLKNYPEGYFTKENPLRMMDYACGDGNTLKAYAKVFKDLGIPATFVCVDINPNHLNTTRDLAEKLGIDSIEFVQADSPHQLGAPSILKKLARKLNIPAKLVPSKRKKVHLITNYFMLPELSVAERKKFFQGLKDLLTDEGKIILASNSKNAYDPSLHRSKDGFTYIEEPQQGVFSPRVTDGKEVIPDGQEVSLSVISRDGTSYNFGNDTHHKQTGIQEDLGAVGLVSEKKYKPTASNLPKGVLTSGELKGLSTTDKEKNSVKMYMIEKQSAQAKRQNPKKRRFFRR